MTLWSELLGTQVGVDDDFFDVGGNSMLAVRACAAMRALGLPTLRLRHLYRHSTIREVVSALGHQSDAAQLPPFGETA